MNFITLEKVFGTVAANTAKLLPLSLLFVMISAVSMAQTPANDNSCQGTFLTPATTCTYVSSSLTNATHSTTGINPTCAGYTSTTVDVWFRAVVPAGGAIRFDMQGGGVTDGGMAVYRGNSCTALTLVACDDNSSGNANMPQITATGLAVGSTVYVRVWSKNGSSGSFGICAIIPVQAPVNDQPCDAIELPVNPTCTYQTFTNASATNTTVVPAPSCAGFLGGDVWFKVVVPTGITALVIDTQTGEMLDGGMFVYRASDCASTYTELICDDNSSANGDMPKVTIGSLTPGETLWIRIWEKDNNNNGTFGICVSIPPPPPAYDDPCNAVEIPVNATTCTFQQFTTQDATGTLFVPEPGCADYQGGDVWFKVVVPAGGAIILDTDEGDITDGGMAAYRGSCNGLTLISCDADNSSNGFMPKLILGGLNPGDTVWVRVWEEGNEVAGTFSICATEPPPPPSNDNPCTAIELTATNICTYQQFTNENATGTASVPDPGCGTYSGGDVWFKVVVPAGGTLVFDSQTGVMTDGAMAIYRGTCNNLTLITCDEDASNNGFMPKISATGLNPGDTVWVRFWEEGNNNNGTFGICVKIPPPPPTNDDPCAAVELPVEASCNYQVFTNESATPTSNITNPGCAGYSGGDVWFKIVVPAGGIIQLDTDEGEITDGGMAVYSGTCGSLTQILCDDNSSSNGNMPKIILGDLTPGDTLWVRVWENGGDNNGSFSICATIPPPPPANDGTCNAIELTAATGCNYQTFTNENATGSLGVPAPGCANYQGGDVWFKVVVPAGGALIFDTEEGQITDGGMAVYSGSCGNLTLIDCDDDGSNNGNMPSITTGGLIPGDTIWVRMWEYGNDGNGTFGICVTIPPPGPVNDDPCGAIELPVAANCSFQTFTNAGAYGTSSVPDPGCADYGGSDVWFKVVVPAGGAITIDTQAGQVTDGGMSVYSGTCSNLTLLECDDDDGAGNMPKITVGGLTQGDTLWVRVWEAFNDNNGTFGICATIPPPPPVNDNPCGAISITAAATCTYETFTNDGAYNTGSVPNPGCGNYQGADVWFQLPAPAAGALNVNTIAGTLTDAAMAVYIADSCSGTMTLLACDDNGSANVDMPYITATGITPGSTVFIRVWSVGGATNAGTFGICATIPPLQPATFSFSCSRDTSFNCGGGDSCFTLTAIIPDIHALTTSYAVNPLSAQGCFNPYTDPGNEGPATDLSRDDVYSDVITLPFTFPFFGTNYNSLVASTNGYISFDATEAGNFSHWNIINGGTPQNLPSDFYDRALIMGPYHDLDPANFPNPGQRIKYNVTGQAPHRRWILSFYRVPLYSAACSNLVENTHQIVLYEGTGVVEVFIFDMQNCLTWNQGRAMVGMQDFDRTRAIMAPGRKATDAPWGRTGLNESWRFVPIGGPTLFKRVELFDTSGNFLATGDTTFLDSASLKVDFRNLCALKRLPAGLNTLLVRAVYQKFDNPDLEEIGADTIQIFVPNLKINFDVTNALCVTPVGSVSVHVQSGVPPFRFSIDSGATWVTDSVFTNLAAGSYYLKVEDNGGCGRDTIVVINAVGNLNPLYTVANASCNSNGSVVVDASSGVPPIRYSSDGGATYQYSNTFSLPAGTYNFHIVDTAGCFKDTTITLLGSTGISISATNSPAKCFGSADGKIIVTASGGVIPYQYSSNGGTTYQFSDTLTVAAGTYSVRIKDAAGCIKDTVITVSQPTALAVSAVVTPVKCFGGADGKIKLTASGGGNPTFEYSFDGGTNYQSFDSLNVAAGTYNIRVRDANGCTKDTVITVSQPTAVTVSALVVDAKCFGSADGVIKLTGGGGTGTFMYSSDNGASYQAVDSFIVPAGIYPVSIVDGNGCRKDTTVTVAQPAAITVTSATITATKCNGSADGKIELVAAGGTPGYTYSKDGGANYQASATFDLLPAAVYSIRIKDANGCTKDTSISVSQPATLTASADAGSANCTSVTSGSVIAHALGGTAPYLFSIDGGTNYVTDSSFTVAQGPVTVTVKDANNCTVVTSATIGFVNDLTVQSITDPTICGNVVVTLTTISNGDNFAWTILSGPGSVSNATALSPTTSPTATTVYMITARKGTECTLTDTVTVVVTNPPTVNAGNGSVIALGQDAQLSGTVSNNANYTWSPTTYLQNSSSLTPTVVMPQETIVYTLTASAGEGCSASDTVTITVLGECIKVKNAFTPNGDGVNDTWRVYDTYSCLANVRVQVFNRYGSRVFQSQNYRNDWSGTYNGQPLPDATYYYVIDFVKTDGVSYQVRGDVTILR